ncbi:MAG TPA: DUF3601 domain-containing protein [Brevundimonas sp.]|nr:DUF3601 domain-containing protein [Brevundimonas sp.]
MYGPKLRGHWTQSLKCEPFKHLKPGAAYVVARAFTDYDGTLHPAGEEWIHLGHNFLPYDDGLSLFVSMNGGDEWQIRLQWRDTEQGPIIDSLQTYIEAKAITS